MNGSRICICRRWVKWQRRRSGPNSLPPPATISDFPLINKSFCTPSARMPPPFCPSKGGRAGTNGSGGGSIAAQRASPFWTATATDRRESNIISILPTPTRDGIPGLCPSGRFARSWSRPSLKRWKTALVLWIIRKIWGTLCFRQLPMSWRTTFRTIWQSWPIIRKAASWSRWTGNLWKPSSSPCCKTASAIYCWFAAASILPSTSSRRISAISAVSIPCKPSTHWAQLPAIFLRCACPKLPARCFPSSGRIAHLRNPPKKSML